MAGAGERVIWPQEVTAQNGIGAGHPNHQSYDPNVANKNDLPPPEFIGDSEFYVIVSPNMDDPDTVADGANFTTEPAYDDFPDGFAADLSRRLHLRKGKKYF